MTLPLILLPGMMCDLRLFTPQINTLSDEREVSVLDITGSDTVEALAETVLAEAPPTFALAGLSMGGIVAMEVARQAPDRVKGLALMDTNALAEADHIKAMREPQMDKARAGHLAHVMRDEMKPHYIADGPQHGDILDLCMEMALDLGPDVFIRQSKALQTRPDQSDTLRRYAAPALVLCGALDALCPPKRHTLMHDLLPNSTLTMIADAGHLPTLEKPGETTAALRGWLKEVDNG